MGRLTVSESYCLAKECSLADKDGTCVLEMSKNCYDKRLHDKLKEYEDLEEQGLLLRLPVAEGEKVWALTYHVECDCNYDCVEIDNYKCEEGIPCEHQYRDYYVREARFQHQMKEVLGKYIFLTKAEAEKALAEMEKENES